MPLTTEQEQLITYIDDQVNEVLSSGGDERALLISLVDIMDDLKKIIDYAVGGEGMDKYYQRYEGFYHFMKLLEEMALCISQEKVKN